MKILIKISILAWMILALNSCQSQPNRLMLNDFEKAISKPNVQLVDVRTPAEYKSGHLKNAINIDYNSPNFKAEISKLDKKKPLYIYCASANRSGHALKELGSLSFVELGDLIGGIQVWREARKEIVK